MYRNFTISLALLLMSAPVLAQDVIVTRNFTGLWDQTEHKSQGINLQIVHQDSGEKRGVAYWFTYGPDDQSAWFVGIGPVTENRVEMVLYELQDVGFLEPGANVEATEVGTLTMEFRSCSEGEVTFATDLAGIGSGSFDVRRISDVHNTNCTGGVSDDTPSDVLFTEQRIALASARQGVNGSGHADFEERPDRTEFSVEVEDLADGTYRIVVGGVDRGALTVSLGVGETEFRSPVEAGKVLLTFDPRGQAVEVHDGQGAVLSSGDNGFEGGGGCTNNCGGDDGGGGDPGIDFGTAMIEVDLSNTGVYPAASGDARLEPREDRTDFSVEIEDVPVGSYDLRIGGDVVGVIEVITLNDGGVQGELEFRNPVEPGKVLLNFDPRGQQIDVLQGGTVVLQTLFPAN
jgi:hypothetical protein